MPSSLYPASVVLSNFMGHGIVVAVIRERLSVYMYILLLLMHLLFWYVPFQFLCIFLNISKVASQY